MIWGETRSSPLARDEDSEVHGKANCDLPGGSGVGKHPAVDRDGLCFPREAGLDIRRRLPGHLVGLAASFWSMPTAAGKDSQVLIQW